MMSHWTSQGLQERFPPYERPNTYDQKKVRKVENI